MDMVGTASWGMGEHQGRKLEWDILVKDTNVLAEALEELQKLTGSVASHVPVALCISISSCTGFLSLRCSEF